MNVASLELCEELYELSGWLLDDQCINSSCTHHGYFDDGVFICPRYHLGYLLRKLPTYSDLGTSHFGAVCRYRTIDGDIHEVTGKTPEDAATKLAIELFKQNILTKETS